MRIPKRISAIFMAVIMLLSMGLNGLVVSAADIGSITIHKYDGVGLSNGLNDGQEIGSTITSGFGDKLSGVEFTITPMKPATLAEVIASKPGATLISELKKDVDYFEDEHNNLYLKGGAPISKVTGDTNGDGSISGAEASTNTGQIIFEDLPLGIYYVEETGDQTDTILVGAQPFFVSIPTTLQNGDQIYNVHVYPKNETLDVAKEAVIPQPGDDGSNIITWEISATFPHKVENTTIFKITDKLDDRLLYIPLDGGADGIIGNADDTENIRITADSPTGTDISHYFKADYGETTAKTITVLLKTQDELDAENLANGTDYDLTKLNVYDKVYVAFDTKFDVSQTTTGDLSAIRNEATLDFTNKDDFTFQEKTDPVNPFPVGIHIVKTDGDGAETLEGAKFYIFNDAGAANLAANYDVTDWAGVDENTPGLLLDSKTGEPWTVTSSNPGGVVNFYGLTAGTYYIVEAEAPSGYNKLANPIKIEVSVAPDGTATAKVGGTNASVVDRVVQANVENYEGFTLPLTGGAGTMLFTLIGLLLIGAAVVIYTISKKRKQQHA